MGEMQTQSAIAKSLPSPREGCRRFGLLDLVKMRINIQRDRDGGMTQPDPRPLCRNPCRVEDGSEIMTEVVRGED